MQNPIQPDAEVLAAFLSHADTLITQLEAVVDDRSLLAFLDAETRRRLLTAAGRVAQPETKEKKRLARAQRRLDRVEKREEQRSLLAKAGVRQLRENPIFLTPKRMIEHGEASAPPPPLLGRLDEARVCYVCRERYQDIHHFYDQLCPTCGDFNFRKRDQQGDLAGRVALLTGARVKIGFQAAIFLLRAGCRVIVTTRFPADAARRYAAEPDFAEWGERLEVHGVDLRHVPSVEALCAHLLATHDRLDFIINNACQTVRRPPGFYDHLMAAELELAAPLSPVERALIGSVSPVTPDGGVVPAALSQLALVPGDEDRSEALFPAGRFDADLQQVDLRTVNSWRLKMAEVPTVELLEVQLVNAVAPFLINARLKPLMVRTPGRDKHIVNVSAMEGQFYRTFKSDRHPHTNMAKASLNMMTRTAALDYIEDGIHMNSVDTGWVTDEDPAHQAAQKREMHNFHPPLDIVDGAARIVDPIFSGLATGEPVWGQFLKDYRITDW
jgi:NAD(P)-dependent dehydrogenase (short-subunit alcohol dehydrogenase family)